MAELVKIALVRKAPAAAELVAVGVFEASSPEVPGLDEAQAAAVARATKRQGWTGKDKQVSQSAIAGRDGVVALHGLGPEGAFDNRKLRQWLERVLEEAGQRTVRDLVVVVPHHPSTSGSAAAERIGRWLALSSYRFDRFQARPSPLGVGQIGLLAPPGEVDAYERGLRLAETIAASVAVSRDLANTPPNEATPQWMAERARELADERGMRLRILDREELSEMRMGGILAVGGGSANPPLLARLDWGEGKRKIALVGKGVTFDTGGISIKPAKAMDEMKYDKCGACAVLGIARAASALEIEGRFSAFLPLVENMPDGRSYRPGDIVRCYNGKTVEITNTDAEGRMILADALAWAAEEKPEVLIELSTLTGACVVALGHHGAGLYTSDDELAAELLAAAEQSGELLWRMPLWSEFGEEMAGVHADLRNSGGRWGGANTAAAFLSHFVGGAGRWAHLDIAGPAYVGSEQKGPRGATGYAVALISNWLLRPSSAGRSG